MDFLLNISKVGAPLFGDTNVTKNIWNFEINITKLRINLSLSINSKRNFVKIAQEDTNMKPL